MYTEEHYSQLLGIHSHWQIREVDLKIDEQRVAIDIEWQLSEATNFQRYVQARAEEMRRRRIHIGLME